MKLTFALLIISLVVLIISCQSASVPSATTPMALENTEEITIEAWDASVEHVGINELHLETFHVLLTNESNRSIKIGIVSLSSGKSVIKRMFSELLQPGEKKDFSLICSQPLERDVRIRELKCKIMVGQDIGTVMCPIVTEKEISIPVPTSGIGYTQPVGILREKTITLTLLSWRESDKVLAGPYSEETYYVCTARPGNKFISLIFELRNDWSKPQKTPYFNFGDVFTDKGTIYPSWQTPSDPTLFHEEYAAIPATKEEIDTLIGNSGGRDLLPGESILGRVIFEVPQDEHPVEASINSLRPLIEYNRNQ